jgi:hypothetical protein
MYETMAVQDPTGVVTVIFGGQIMIGGSVSFTRIANVQVEVFPDASVAVAVTVVIPTGKKLPDE